eukprot:scaffold25789_cov51-Phaeocystis_antarctica.AAC.2
MPRLPSAILPAQHNRPHLVGCLPVRRRPQNSRRQRLELRVVPPLRLGHLGALFPPQPVEGPCRGPCPALRAHRVALFGLEHCTEVVVRRGLVRPQGDGLAVGLPCSAPVLLRGVPRALSTQLIVLVARLRGDAGLLLRDLPFPLLPHPSILRHPPTRLHLLVIHRVPLPSARVPRAVDAAPVSRRHLELDALRAHRVLLTVVVHIRRQPGAAEASEAQRRVRSCAALVGSSGWGGGGGLSSLARLGLQRRQRLAELLGGRSQVWLLLTQLGEQRLEAEVGLSDSQSTHGLEEGIGRAGFAHATRVGRQARVSRERSVNVDRSFSRLRARRPPKS